MTDRMSMMDAAVGADRASVEAPASDPEEGPHDAGYRAALDRALALLAARGHSRQELGAGLLRGGFEARAVAAVQERLAQLSLVDDHVYAGEWVERHVARGGISPDRARRELAARGVSEEAVEASLADAGSSLEVALAAAQTRLPIYQKLDRQTAYRRLAGFLARRGHGEEVVEEVCRNLLGPDID